MSVKRILIISFSVVQGDPRVYRQISLLREKYAVSVVGYGPVLEGVSFYGLDTPRSGLLVKLSKAVKCFLRLFDFYYWGLSQVKQAKALLHGREFDLVVANESFALPLALKIANNAPVLVDAHEYSPRQYEDRRFWRLLSAPFEDYLCRRFLCKAKSMTTVCKGISDEYLKEYGVASKVVRNSPGLMNLAPSAVSGGR